ncbi:MAG: glycosyltransferase family 2 protein [Bacteroidia bacterium]
MISIIVPAYNSEKTIAACLDSLVAQTLGEKEIIVMDGLSTDKTIDVIRDFAMRFPFVNYHSEKDHGIYDAINKGIRAAKGEWIYIIGSDDRLFETTTLEKVHTLMRGVNSGAVYGSVKVIGDAGWAADGEIYGGEFTLEKLVQKNICQQAVFYHRSLFEQIGYFNINYPVCADWDFILHCAGKSSMKYIPLTIAEFYGGGTSKVVKEERFYAELASNLYAYFGLRIFKKEFAPAGGRFERLSQDYSAQGKKLKSYLFMLVAQKHKNQTPVSGKQAVD